MASKILIIIGIIFIIFGVLLIIENANLRRNGYQTIATVVELREVEIRGRRGRRTRIDVFVNYTVDNIIYKNQLFITPSGTYIGEEILIYYNTRNPGGHIITVDNRSDNSGGPLLLIIAAILICIGIIKRKRIIKT